MKPLHWFIIGFVLTVLEIVVPGFVIFWFGIAGIVTGVVALLITNVPAQFAIFAVLSGIMVVASQRIAKRWTHGSPKQVGSERLPGSEGLVTEAIRPPAMGMVRVLGEDWRAEADAAIEAGRTVRVKKGVGTHLVVGATNRDSTAAPM